MEGSGRVKLIIVGLFLASIALGYFIFTQFASRSERVANNQTVNRNLQPIVQVSPTPTPTVITPTPTQIAQGDPNVMGQTKGGVPTESLPKTGIPAALVGALALSAVAAGLGLRKYPN